LIRLDVSSWDQDVVGCDTLAGVWHPQGVVESGGCLIVCESVKIPVGLFEVRKEFLKREREEYLHERKA
jgi:hypothetical protein